MLIPAMRAMSSLPLPLLVSWVRADDEHRAVATDDLALLAHGLDRGSDLHARSLRSQIPGGRGSVGAALEAAWASAPAPGTGRRTAKFPLKARPMMVATGAGLGSGRFAAGLVPGREDPRALGGDGHGELEVGGEGPVLGVVRPVVLPHPDGVAAGRGHGLDGQDHAL